MSETLSESALLSLLDIARMLAATTDLPQVLERVIDAGRSVLHADRGAVFLYDDKARELHTLVATGEKEIRISIDKGIAGDTARTRAIQNVPDCYADPRFNQDVDRRTGYRTHSLISVPLIGLEDELVGVLQLLNPDKPHFDEVDERVAGALAGQAAVAIQRARLLDERIVKLKLERDLSLAREIQQGVLPQDVPHIDGYELAAFNDPADETGGDIFDLVVDDAGGVMMMLADATGHGIGPALSVTQARAMFRMGQRLHADLDRMVVDINHQLCADLSSSRFITAFFGRLDPRAHRVHYQAPGQGPLLHFAAATDDCRWLDASTIPLGIMAEFDMSPPEPIDLAPGDMLVLLTDGFYEYQNGRGEQFDKRRVGEIIIAHKAQSPQAILDALLAAVLGFAAGAPQLDDLTAIILKRV